MTLEGTGSDRQPDRAEFVSRVARTVLASSPADAASAPGESPEPRRESDAPVDAADGTFETFVAAVGPDLDDGTLPLAAKALFVVAPAQPDALAEAPGTLAALTRVDDATTQAYSVGTLGRLADERPGAVADETTVSGPPSTTTTTQSSTTRSRRWRR
jgi:hypothetical protein